MDTFFLIITVIFFILTLYFMGKGVSNNYIKTQKYSPDYYAKKSPFSGGKIVLYIIIITIIIGIMKGIAAS